MSDTLISFESATGQTLDVILYLPSLSGGHCQAWNPTLGTPAFDGLTAANWSQHLLAMSEPDSLGNYELDLSALAHPLPAGVQIVAKIYASATAGATPIARTQTLYWDGTQLLPAIGAAGSGVGAWPVTVIVTSDGVHAVPGAIVRLTTGGEYYTAIADVSGHAQFSLNAAGYTLSAVANGYTFAPTSETIDTSGHWNGTTSNLLITLTAVTITPAPSPGAPPMCTVTLYTLTAEGAVDPSITVNFQILTGPGIAGLAYWTPQSITSDGTGLVALNLPQGAKVQAQWGTGPPVTFTVPATANALFSELLGQ